MVEHRDHLEVGPGRQRQHHVAGAEPRVEPAVAELLAEQLADAVSGALQSIGACCVRDVVEAHVKHSRH